MIQISKQSTVTTRVTQNNGQGPANVIDVVKGTGNKYAPESLSHLIRYLKFVCRSYKWMRSFNWIFEVPCGKFPCKASRMKWTLVSDFSLISKLLWWIPSRNSPNRALFQDIFTAETRERNRQEGEHNKNLLECQLSVDNHGYQIQSLKNHILLLVNFICHSTF